MKKLEYLGNYFKTGKHFSREIFQSEDDNKKQNSPQIDTYIKRKISLSLTFQIHFLSPYVEGLNGVVAFTVIR